MRVKKKEGRGKLIQLLLSPVSLKQRNQHTKRVAKIFLTAQTGGMERMGMSRTSAAQLHTLQYIHKKILFLEIKNIIVLNRAFLKLHYMLKHPKALSTHYNYDSENFKDNTMGNQQKTK